MVVSMLADGMSVRAVQRVTGVHPVTTLKLLVRVAERCQQLMDEHMRDLRFETLELDEAWSYVAKKEKRIKPGNPAEWGDQYVFVAQDRLTKVVPCFRLGTRDNATTAEFLADVASRVVGVDQVNTDGWAAYTHGVPEFFGRSVAFCQIIKKFHETLENEHRYSLPAVVGVDRMWRQGMPKHDCTTTSHVEAQNTGLRTACKRLARLTLCFSKKWENLLAALRLHYAAFNFVRRHNTLGMCPALAAGVVSSTMTMSDLVP